MALYTISIKEGRWQLWFQTLTQVARRFARRACRVGLRYQKNPHRLVGRVAKNDLQLARPIALTTGNLKAVDRGLYFADVYKPIESI